MPTPDPRLPERLRRNAVIRRGEASVIRAVMAAFRTLARKIAAALDGSRFDPNTLDTRWPEWREAVETTILPAVDDVFGNSFREQVHAADFTPDVYATQHLSEVRNRLVNVPDAIFSMIADALEEGRDAGEGIPELAKRVDGILSASGQANWKHRAVTIARTEVIAAYNDAKLDGAGAMADALRIPRSAVIKEWFASEDTRTRDSHRHADGQQQPLDQRFALDGGDEHGTSFGMAPGDPSLPPWEVINCRCTMLTHFPGDHDYPKATR